jgi:hypothetical protein
MFKSINQKVKVQPVKRKDLRKPSDDRSVYSILYALCWVHRLNMELDFESLFGLLCAAVLVG